MDISEGDAAVQSQIVLQSSSPSKAREKGAMTALNEREPTRSTWIISYSPSCIIIQIPGLILDLIKTQLESIQTSLKLSNQNAIIGRLNSTICQFYTSLTHKDIGNILVRSKS